ncbi:MFS monocarboxylate transporter [Coniochaeta sp. 2T2.1]|nr:MFS monocarboxylate transporter [Coniochaeta sp. 2T2.1]
MTLTFLLSSLVLVNTIGYANSYGVFEQYYVSKLRLSVSQISWAGSIQVFLLCAVPIVTGRVFHYGLLRALLVVGGLLQGICGGIGGGLVHNPTLMCVATYFPERRAFAHTLVTVGASPGGIVLSIIRQQMLPHAGLAWTLRCMALVVLVNSILVVALVRDRLPPRPRAPSSSLITHYAVTVLGVDHSNSLIILLILNSSGYPVRILSALEADAYLGPLRTPVVLALILGVLFIGWIGAKTVTSLYVLASLFGLANGAGQGMIVAGLPSLTTDLNRLGTRSGMILGVRSLAVLTGPPMAGALIEVDHGRYLYMQI